jgi:small-conductance mechanosensitive channel
VLLDALKAEASQRDIKHLIRGVIKSLVILLAFLAFAFLLARWMKRLRHKLATIAFSKLPKVSFGRVSIFSPRLVSIGLGMVVHAVHYTVFAVVAFICIAYVLGAFPYTHPWAITLESSLVALLLNLGKGILHGLPGLLAIVFIVFVARILTRLTNGAFKAIERGEVAPSWMSRDAAAPTRRIVVALIWIFAIVMAYPYIPGNESIAFKSVGIFVGLLVSFGSSGVVNQAMNGLSIMYAKSFKCGDYVRIGDVEGTVYEVTMLSTKLHTIRLEEIVIPNSQVMTQTVYNYTRIAEDSGVGISTAVTAGYGTPWRQVHALLNIAAEKTKGLSKTPAPYVIQTALSDNSVEYVLVAHIVVEPKLRQFVKSELHQNIQDTFNQYGVSLMSPVHITSKIPPALPVEKWCVESCEKESAES